MSRKPPIALQIAGLVVLVALGTGGAGLLLHLAGLEDALRESVRGKSESVVLSVRSLIAAEQRSLVAIGAVLKENRGVALGLRRYEKDAHNEELRAILEPAQRALGVDILTAITGSSVVAYRAYRPEEHGDVSKIWGVAEALAGEDLVVASKGPSGIAIRAIAPARLDGAIVGAVMVGTLINDAFAARIASQSKVQVSFASSDRIWATSAPPDPAGVGKHIESVQRSLYERRPVVREDRERGSIYQYAPVRIADETFHVIVDLDTTPTHGLLARASREMLATTFAVLVVALAIGGLMAWRLARPLRALQRKALGMAGGAADEVNPVRGNEIEALHSALNYADVTITRRTSELRRLNERLEQRVAERTEELRAALIELEAFSYSVSHDLRAPIGAIGSFAGLLRMKEGGRLSEDGRTLLGYVDLNASHAAELIEGLLEFSRLGRQNPELRSFSMRELVSEVLQALEAERKAQVSCGELPDGPGDPLLIRQVWTNLVGNALKFSRKRSPARIELGYEAPQHAYFVRDNGIGFDNQYATKIFGVFERLHDGAEFEGTGLGLAIAERIVGRHGGRIWAEGAPGAGATFRFTLNQHDPRAGDPLR